MSNKLLHKAEVHMVQSPELEAKETEDPIQLTSSPLVTDTPMQEEFECTLLASLSIDGHIWLWNTDNGTACHNRRFSNLRRGKCMSI